MRFRGVCYRAHDPRWSFKPLSGEGATIRGARFNPKGVATLYLALTVMGAVKEANQGFAHRIDPCVLCSYAVDCDDVIDLRTAKGREEADVSFEEMAGAWMTFLSDGRRPLSWGIYDRLKSQDRAGILVPSFAPGAESADENLVLWKWRADPPYKVDVIDPSGRLLRNQLSWN